MKIHFRLNDQDTLLDCSADRRVIDLLREDLGLTATKEACGSGECALFSSPKNRGTLAAAGGA